MEITLFTSDEGAKSSSSLAKVTDQNSLNLIREHIDKQLGIHISEDKDYLLKSKLEKIMKEEGFSSYSRVYAAIKENNIESLEILSRYITTSHTFFFREKTHLKILRNDIKLRHKEQVLIWCAACATGEEVYSMIITLLEAGIFNFKILASDINRDSLIQLKRGIYPENRLKYVNNYLRKKYFLYKSGTDYYKVKSGFKQYFITKRLNLMDNLLFEKKFHYIFCRNVLMYFNRETQTRVVFRLLRNLEDFGYFFIGQSESLLHLSHELETVFSSVYNKKL
jgi:chemotaxis protein methyltransferase CheR